MTEPRKPRVRNDHYKKVDPFHHFPAPTFLADDIPAWMDDAACLDEWSDLFFPGEKDQTLAEEAKAVCAQCPVANDCLRHAFITHDKWAVMGGTTPQERERMRRASRRRRARRAG